MADHESREFSVERSPSPMKCPVLSLQAPPGMTTAPSRPSLIFTHGAGGTLESDAIANFSSGFSEHLPILCFQGNSNLKSRAKMFSAVIKHKGYSSCLGGRSMGARAAIMAATDKTRCLVLVSYPLHTGKETRDQILLDLPSYLKIIFVSGDRDSMCDLERLNQVRTSMKCKSWLITVKDADHGMTVKPKKATEKVGRKTGEVVAAWLHNHRGGKREGTISWNVEEEEANWSGWNSMISIPSQSTGDEDKLLPEKSTPLSRSKAPKTKISKKSDRRVGDDAISTRTRKRKRSRPGDA